MFSTRLGYVSTIRHEKTSVIYARFEYIYLRLGSHLIDQIVIDYFLRMEYKRVPFSSVVTSSKAGSIAFTKASNHVWYADAMNLGSTPAVRQ